MEIHNFQQIFVQEMEIVLIINVYVILDIMEIIVNFIHVLIFYFQIIQFVHQMEIVQIIIIVIVKLDIQE